MINMKAFIRHRVEEIMKSGEKTRLFSLTFLLHPLSWIYGKISDIRWRLYEKGILKIRRLPCKVIAVGNLTMGGTGKTPMTIYLAELCQRWGVKTVIISRGYGGSEEKTGGIVTDGKTIRMSPRQAGDEPYMMAARSGGIPVVVGADRYRSGQRAVQSFQPEVIILDDAFQHIRLHRDLNLLLFDFHRPLGNRHLFPRGILRESISAAARADALILTRCDGKADKQTWEDLKVLKKAAGHRPVFKSAPRAVIRFMVEKGRHIKYSARKETVQPDSLKGKKVFAFSGIADNYRFLETMIAFGCHVQEFYEFSDHHPYCFEDIDNIMKKGQDADAILTTEKDFMRIDVDVKVPVDLIVIGIDMDFGTDESALVDYIRRRLLY